MSWNPPFSNREDAILFYLLASRFPDFKFQVPERDLLSSRRDFEPGTPAAEITAYFFDELKLKSSLELLALCFVARQNARTQIALERDIGHWVLDHDHPNYTVDVQWWAIQPCLNTHECAWILLGKDPREMNWDDLKQHVSTYGLAAKYRDLFDLLNRAVRMGQLQEPITAPVLVDWAQGKIDLPLGLEEAMRVSPVFQAGLVSRIKELEDLRSRVKELESQRGLHPKERTTFHKVLLGLKKRLGPNSTAASMSRELENLGYFVHQDTLRSHLSGAAESVSPDVS